MHRSSLTASAVLHVAAIIMLTVSFPWLKKTYDIPPPIAVDIVTTADLSQTTKPAAQPVQKPPEKKIEEPPKPDKHPAPAPTNKSEMARAPVLKPPEKVEEKPKPEEKVVDENAPPQKKPEKKPDKKVEDKPKPEEKKDFASVLKNLADEKPKPVTPWQQAMVNKTPTPDGQPLPLGQRMTMSETDALRRQLEGCWNVPYGAKDAENTAVDVFMVINKDRTLQTAQIVDMSRYNSDTFFRAMADSAMRAVRNPNCSPFDLPPDKYEAWKTITMTFDPSQMF